MFASFFPKPRLLFGSAILWTAVCMAVWYLFARDLGRHLSLGWIVGIHYPPPLARRWRRCGAHHLCLRQRYRGRCLALPVHVRRRRHLRSGLAAVFAPSLVPLVGGRLVGDPVHRLVPGPARRADQQLVRLVLRPHPEVAGLAQCRHQRRLFRPARDVPDHRDGLYLRRRLQRLPGQPLHLPLAHGDERLLRRQLAEAAR